MRWALPELGRHYDLKDRIQWASRNYPKDLIQYLIRLHDLEIQYIMEKLK